MVTVAKKESSPFGQRLRALRQAAGFTQTEIAAIVEVGIQTYMRWERGETEPTFSALCDLASALGVTIDKFQEPAE